ncbi:hypothetical protein JCM17844_17920 [Iodidimonas gelatinilytica]|uniref:Uncharacterized protein n=1 Tax=Iodidimonas gelatinilytica TaxID=1236966 RepID=A0A5A7MT64_9PROT|nr:hypothetical protein [Iodidimonas gelatinilytica]GEQ98155.1 hypothetical protein JCM17844_17920 [Iodidimonas gelatinilytica]
MRDAKKDIVVRRSYRSGFQRNAIRKALRARFDILKARQSRFGRGRFRSAIFDALSRNADTIRYPDGKPILFGEDAITDSDLRDALSPNADLTKTWQTNDQKVRLYDAYLQLVDDTFPSAAAISQRYENAKETLQAKRSYPADSWQARGRSVSLTTSRQYGQVRPISAILALKITRNSQALSKYRSVRALTESAHACR